MKTFHFLALLLFAQTMLAHCEIPEHVTDLGGGDDIEALIKGYPEETHDVSSTLCGIKTTPEFRQGYNMALRLCFLGAKPHYLEYDELGPLSAEYLPLRSYRLKNYKHSARLLEAIRGFNYSMAMKAWEQQVRAKTKKGEQAGAGLPASRSESDSEGGDKPQPESEGRSR